MLEIFRSLIKNFDSVSSLSTLLQEELSHLKKVFIEINNFAMKVMNTIINQESSPNKVTNSELNEMKQQKKQ